MRIILNQASDATPEQTRLALERVGASVHQRLDSLNVVIADVPVERLEELEAQGAVAWMSADQEVRTLAAPTDNTSHVAVTTGANKVLPFGNENLADGGGGNKIGIAVLDSGISPPDAAEFAGYSGDTAAARSARDCFRRGISPLTTALKNA